MVSTAKHWVATTDGYFMLKNISQNVVGESDLLDYAFYGFIIRQTILWKLDPLPVSPHLIAVIFGNYQRAMVPSFIDHVSEQAAIRLATWPPAEVPQADGTSVRNLSLLCDPMTLIMETISELTVLIHVLGSVFF